MKEDRRFSAREMRALLWLLPVLAVASWLVWEVATATADPDSAETEGNTSTANFSHSDTDVTIDDRGQSGGQATLGDKPEGSLPGVNDRTDFDTAAASPPLPTRLFVFDPNTVEYHDLMRLGFERGEALGIIKYRERGKVFEIPEDFAACYQVSEEMYSRLKQYIRIGEQFRLRKFERSGSSTPTNRPTSNTPVSRRSDPPVFVGGVADGVPTAVSERKNGTDRTTSTEEQGSGAVSESRVEFARTLPSREEENQRLSVAGAPISRGNQPILIDLNTADSAELISVAGIGERTVVSIMAYRARLGGFARVEQLAEVRGVTEQNYERIIEQIYLDPAVIQKIDINFAPAKILAVHPYIRAEALRKLLKERQLKGGWRSITELETDDIFTADELIRLGPYLIFN